MCLVRPHAGHHRLAIGGRNGTVVVEGPPLSAQALPEELLAQTVFGDGQIRLGRTLLLWQRLLLGGESNLENVLEELLAFSLAQDGRCGLTCWFRWTRHGARLAGDGGDGVVPVPVALALARARGCAPTGTESDQEREVFHVLRSIAQSGCCVMGTHPPGRQNRIG